MDIRTDIKTVAVLGSGTMGAGIAQIFAQSGRKVLMYDPAAGAVERAIAGIGKFLAKSVSFPTEVRESKPEDPGRVGR